MIKGITFYNAVHVVPGIFFRCRQTILMIIVLTRQHALQQNDKHKKWKYGIKYTITKYDCMWVQKFELQVSSS